MKIWKWLTAREHRLVFCGILAALVATVAYAGVIVHGQLVDASLENLSSDPTSHSGRVYFNTSTNQPKIYNGSAWTGLGSGAGSGEKNYLASGSSSATGWTASGAGVTCSTPTTNLPDPSLSTALGVTGVSGSTAFCYATFTLDDADFNKKMKLAFDQFAVSGYVASDMRVDVCSCGSAFSGGACSSGTVAQGCGTNATRLALSTDSSAVSDLPALTGTYRTTWDSPGSSQKYIQVQVGLNGSNTHQLNLANIVAGPGVVTQGAALGPWQAFTPSVTNYAPTATGIWRQNGAGIEVMEHLVYNGSVPTGAITLTLPNSYTMSSALFDGSGDARALGTATGSVSSTGAAYVGSVMWNNSTTVVIVGPNNVGLWNATTPWTWGVTDNYLDVHFTTPVDQLAGSGTVNVVQNDCEYAYNTSTSTTASDGTSFAYGPSGAQIQSITADLKRGVKFKTISATDKLWIELWDGTTGDPWMDAATYTVSGVPINFSYQNGSSYGVGFSSIKTASEDATVEFGTNAVNLGTYGAGTTRSWSAWGVNTYYWRVKKCAGGQAVGFGIVQPGTSAGLVSASGVPGVTTAPADVAGYIGETFSDQASTGLTTSAANIITRILQPGKWAVWANVSGSSTGSITGMRIGISTSTGAYDSSNADSSGYFAYNSTSGTLGGSIGPRILNISSATTVYLVAQSFTAASTGGAGINETLICMRVR